MKKVLSLFVLVIFLTCLSGCMYNVEYNCKIYNSWFNYNDFIKEEFYLENKVKYANYDNINYDPTNPKNPEYIEDWVAPSKRLIVVNNNIEASKIFTNEVDVDFDEEILLIYIFTDCNSKYRLEKVTLNENVLEIKYDSYNVITTQPEETFIVFKLDKVEFKDVKINNNLFVDASTGGHHHEYINNICNCGIIKNKSFYTVDHAYNYGWMSKVELENTAYYNNRDHEKIEMIKELEEEILNDFSKEYNIDLVMYPGTVRCFYIYEGAIAIKIDGCGLNYSEVHTTKDIDGVTFSYHNSQTLLVWTRNK